MKQVLEQAIKKAIQNEFGQEYANSAGLVLSYPPDGVMGDYASNAGLVLAKGLKMNPKEVAERLVEAISREFSNSKSPISNIQILGGFINFTLNPDVWAGGLLGLVNETYGQLRTEHPEKIVLEYLSPNTNKPLHLGHLRNGVFGVAVGNLLKATGNDVTKVQIINDRGIAICKAMLAWMKWGDGVTPLTAGVKGDRLVGEFYVRFAKESENDPTLLEEAQELLRRWESGDAEVRKVWAMMNDWVYEGWEQTVRILGFDEDKKYYESSVFSLGKDLIVAGLQKGIFLKGEESAVLFSLPAEEFGLDPDGKVRKSTLVRKDGTAVYITQDLGLAVTRAQEFSFDRMIYITGSEQRFHFQTLFAILKALGFAWAENLLHLWYAMVYLPDGKMKSREGTVVDADDLIAQMTALAKTEIITRLKTEDSSLENPDMEERSLIIGLSALKFYLLKHKPVTDIYFDPKESISFEGNTGPYCLYTYARAKSILRQVESGEWEAKGIDFSVIDSGEERILIRQLAEFPEVVGRAAKEYNPALLTTFVFETCQAFNTFYTKHPVLKAETEEIKNARLQLVSACAQVIKNGLGLLGIKTVEEM